MPTRMRRTALCLLLLAATTIAESQERPKFKFVPGPKPGGGDVNITLDGVLEAQKDDYAIMNGNVRVEYQDIKMRSDKLTINHRTKDVVAEGNVVIDQGPTRITATQAIYNLDSKTGTFFNATAIMDPSMYFSGDRIEKIDADTYRMSNGIFTSCDLDRPAWSFHVGSAEVTVDDYAYLRNLSFRARNVPVFYTPRLIWPTKRERSKGLLIPRVRVTNKFGARLENGYFVPIGDSADATIYADVSTNGYFGAGTEVRYVPSENVKIGDFRGHLVNNVENKQVEWKYAFQHAQDNLPGGFRGVVDVQDFSNLDFFRQYDHDPELHTLSNIYSSAYLTKNRPTYSLNILSDRRDIIFANDRQRFEQLPSVQFRMYPQRILGMPLYFSMESSSSRLRTGAISGGVRTIGADYFRTDVFPTVALQLRTPTWLSIKPQVSVRETYYSASRDEFGKVDDDDPITRFYAQGQVETVGPSFSRVFNRAVGGFSKFKHVIEPRVRYVYTTNVKNQEDIVRFDLVDTPALPIVQHSVEYSLTQRLIGKENGPNGSAREVLSFSLRQSVALSDPFPQAGTAVPDAGEHKYTPLTANLRFNPYQSITVDSNATYGNISHQLDQVSFSANLVGTGKRADKYLGLTYFATFEQPNFPGGESSGFRLNTGSSLVKDRIRADVQLNFDAKDGRFLEQRYLAGWTGSCYGIALEYRRYLVFPSSTQQEELDSYGIAITLKNIGTIPLH